MYERELNCRPASLVWQLSGLHTRDRGGHVKNASLQYYDYEESNVFFRLWPGLVQVRQLTIKFVVIPFIKVFKFSLMTLQSITTVFQLFWTYECIEYIVNWRHSRRMDMEET